MDTNLLKLKEMKPDHIQMEQLNTVVARYVDENGEDIIEPIETTDVAGENYKTVKKTFKDYDFVEVIGNEEGKYIDGTIEVTYVYKNATGDVDIEPIEPPHTDASIVTNENTLYFEDKKKYLK